MFQCYFFDKEGKQCQNQQEDYWCSFEHKTLWQAVNYNDSRDRQVRKKTIIQMQKGFRQMAHEARERRFRKQQKLL